MPALIVHNEFSLIPVLYNTGYLYLAQDRMKSNYNTGIYMKNYAYRFWARGGSGSCRIPFRQRQHRLALKFVLPKFGFPATKLAGYTGGQKCMSFSALQPAKKKKIFTSGIEYTGHRSPPPCLHEPLT